MYVLYAYPYALLEMRINKEQLFLLVVSCRETEYPTPFLQGRMKPCQVTIYIASSFHQRGDEVNASSVPAIRWSPLLERFIDIQTILMT